MKKFFKAIAAPATVLSVVLALGLSMTRCTDVDDTLGQDFIPGHQRMTLQINTLSSVRTYLAKNDSIVSNYTGNLYFGRMEDPVFGTTVAAAMTDFYPISTSFNDGNFFGYLPVADSAYMELYVTNVYGNPAVPQTFNVYALKDSLKRDSVYYFNLPLRDVVDPPVLFSFEMDLQEKADYFQVKLMPTPAGMAFLQKIVDTDSEIFKAPYPAFHEKFYGLYFEAAPATPDNSAVYEINVRTHPSYSFSSSLVVFMHNYEEENPTVVDTTLAVRFPFSDTSYPNMNVNSVLHTNPLPIASNTGNPPVLSALTAQSTVYVQSLGGVATYLDFSVLAAELARMTAGRSVVVNQARIYFPIEDGAVAALNAAPLRLGMYYTYGQAMLTPGSVYGPIPIPDYLYEAENNVYSPVTIPFNGHIYRSPNPGLGGAPYYRMDITRYITSLIQNPENTPTEVWLGNEINTRSSTYTQVALQGWDGMDGTESPIKLVVTYTLLQ